MSVELVRIAVARHLSGLQNAPVRQLRPGGSAFAVGTGVIARVGGAAGQAAALEVVAPRSTVPVPEPLFVDAELDVLGYRRIDGVPLRTPELTAHGVALGAFIGRLHGTFVGTADRVVPAATAQDLDPAAALESAHDRCRRLHPGVTVAVRALLERAVSVPAPAASRDRALCHLDLRAEHVLVDPPTGELTGVIDWGGAAIADPARDLASVLAHLGRPMFDVLAGAYRGGFDAHARERAEVYARCLLIEGVEQALIADDRADAQNTLRRIQILVRGR